MPRADHVISVDALAARMGSEGLSVLDASWHLPTTGRDARAEFEIRHIPGAVFFDIDEIADRDDPLPHAMPSSEQFAAQVGALGVARDDTIVVYDTVGLMSAARAWFMLRAMGATDVRVLDGGFPAWKRAGRAVEAGPAEPVPVVFHANPDAGAVAQIDDVRRVVADGGAQLVDARGAARFKGEAPEPRPGLRSGHMPGARNLPFDSITGDDGSILPDDRLRHVLAEAGVADDMPVITTCGSGVTAAVLSLALAILGRPSRLYDGSWAEWGRRNDTAVETG